MLNKIMRQSILFTIVSIVIIFSVYILSSFDLYGISKDSDLQLKIMSDSCIFNQGNHVAFTALEKWDGNLYLAFREGMGHRSVSSLDRGKIRILKREKDSWKTEIIFSHKTIDLRDPSFLIWKNSLYVYTVNGFFSKLTNKGWSHLHPIIHDVNHPIGIWKIREYKNTLYGIGYRSGKWPILLSSIDGINWKTVTEFCIGGDASEGDLIFKGDSVFTCLRIDNPIGSNSMWGKSKYPFNCFEWRLMNVSIASPELFLEPKSKKILLAGREYDFSKDKVKKIVNVSLFSIDTNGIDNRLYIFNTGIWGDKGYPSLCNMDDFLYMSYYLGDSQTGIRLATMKMEFE